MHRRRVYLILGVVGVVLAGVLLVVFSREREPEYGGKRLSEWVEEFPSGFSVETQQARQAVRHIGTNALPFLVEWIAYEQPPWKAKLIRAAYGLPLGRRLGWMMRDKKASRAFGATLAFECIGAEAEGAIPTLANMAT